MPKSARREAHVPANDMKDAQASHQDCTGLLKTIDKSLEDIRAAITCRVCVRPLYEPFTIECGHTFCYSCLVSWFEKNPAHKSCPDCRAGITRKPAPAYLVRDITQLFSIRPELLPAGETTQEHQDQQQEEARILEEDKNGRGLFRGSFRDEERQSAAFGNRIIIDDEDGVHRCPRCTWEMEDDLCAGCGWPVNAESWDLYSGSEAASDDDELEDALLRQEMGILEDDEDDEDEEDDSASSLDGFVVNDEPVRGNRQTASGNDQPLRFRRHLMGPNESSRGHSRPPMSSIDVQTSDFETDSQALNVTSDDNTDAPSLFGGRLSRSMSSESQSNEISSSVVFNPPSNTWYMRNRSVFDDSNDESVISISTENRNAGQRRRDRVSNPAGRGNRRTSNSVTEILSDTAELEPLSRTCRNRSTSNTILTPDYNTNRAVEYLTSDDEDSPRIVQRQNMHSSADVHAMRRRAARPIVIDEEDDDDSSTAIIASDQRSENTLRRPVQSISGLPQQERRALLGTSSPNEWASEQIQNNVQPTSRLDPSTSIPIRRENANMPGAFPPSFVSEQSQTQPTPPVDRGLFARPNSPERSSTSRPAWASDEYEQAFLDRRHSEPQTTQANHVQQPRHRDRSAAKAARRHDRQRAKAEIDARSRRGGEPSGPPLITL